jgi:hypothetical protein
LLSRVILHLPHQQLEGGGSACRLTLKLDPNDLPNLLNMHTEMGTMRQ